jgi:Tol biopolymer transport system component
MELLRGQQTCGKVVVVNGKRCTARRATLYRIAAALAVVGAIAVLCWSLISRSSNAALWFVPLASLPGEEVDPSISPDGGYVAFSYRQEGGSNFALYIKGVGAGDPLRLTNTPESERYPQWSPDSSQLAFLRMSNSGVGVWVIGALGGGERKIATVGWPSVVGDTALAWSRTGDSLIVADRESDQSPPSLYSLYLATGSRTRLTYPLPGTFGDANPVCSPTGEFLAFTHQIPSRVMDIWVMARRGGEPKRVTWDKRNISGLAWTEDGKHLVFLSDRGGPDPALWKVPAGGGRPQLLAVLPAYSRMLAVAWRTGRIAYSRFVVRSSIWRYALDDAGAKPEKLITSSRIQASPQYSPDGRSIAFMSDRAGYMEIWVARSDGNSPRRLTDLRGEGSAPRWSPDGKRIAFDMRVQGNHGIFVVSADGGPVVQLVANPFENGAPSWSRDGRWIYFASNRTGRHQVWKIPAAGGSPVQVTRDGGAIAFESPDGAILYYAKGREQPGLWKKILPGGEEVPVLPDYAWAYFGSWQVTREGVCFIDMDNKVGARSRVIRMLPYGGGAARVLTTLYEATFPASFAGGVTVWHPMAVSPDGKYLLMTLLDQHQSNIMIAEGFH